MEIDDDWESNPSEYTAYIFLRERGYIESRNGFWTKPSPDHMVTKEESEMIWYLINEWDFGGLDG
jgi:hypothetical protein